ncbi:Adhesin yadA precursor [Gallibacterium anatis]|uniref:Adhesin yadA n=2 Tax=Gallibacterium anatis TaxID=750 RepID=A0A377H7Z2_9PAST|nr:YadA-like family protein [Gallibacterium anatis]STO38716.1 Adhesin yadA precursor [Gallibacterium anatis]
MYHYKDLETSLTTTMGGGLTFEGNTGETWKRNLGDTVTIKGGFEPQNGETYTDKTTDQNTYVALETDDASKKSLVVRLAKELRDLTSAEFKNTDGTTTTVNGGGITIKPSSADANKTVSLTDKGLNNGGNKITNVGAGDISENSTDAINGGQLYQYQQATNTAVAQARTQVTGTGAAIVTKTTTDGRDSYNVHVEETMAFTNADGDKLIKGADGKWYKPTDIAGKVYDATSKTWKQVGDDGSLQNLAQQPPAEMIKGADGKWYKPDDIKGLVYNDGAWKKVGEDGSMQEVTPPTATSPSLRLVDADGGTNNTIKLENLASAIGGKVVDEAMNGNNSFINNLRTVGEPNGITPNAAVTTQDLRNLADTGFKLQTNSGTAQTVKLGDTVQVLDGKNTRVSTITSNNGVHSYAINVEGLPMSFTDDQGNALVKVGDNFYKASDIGAGDTLVKVGDKLYKASDLDNQGQPKSGATEITASTPAGVSLVDKEGKSTSQQLSGIQSSVADVEIKGTDGQVNQNASFTDKLAQPATDAKRKDNAVNVSDLNEVAKAAKDAQATADKGFNVKVSASGTGVASATDDLKENGQNIKPGDTFTFEAGDNITLTQAQGKLTIATNNQGIVNNAQLPVAYTTDKDGKQQKVYKGEDGQFYTVAGVNKDGNIVGKDGSVTSAKDKVVLTGDIITSVQNADGSVTNPSKLTNVADGAVAKGSKDAINGGQLYEYLGIKEGDDIQITQVTVNKPDGTTTVINVPTDKAGKPYLTTYNVKEQGEHITNNVYTAIRNMNEQGIKYFHVNAGQDIPEKQASNSEDSNASAKYAAAIGYQANVESGAEGGLAIGKGATVTKDSVGSIAIGSGGKVSGKNSISIGSGNTVKGDGSGAFGDPSSVTGNGSYALGNNNTIEANNAFAVGNETKVTADNAVAVGHKTKVTTKNSVALGANAQATQTIEELQSAVPVGDPERVRGYGKQVIGEVSVGGVNEAGEQEVRRITNVAAGSAPTDAVNVSQLEASKYETNKKINRLARDIDKLDKRIDGVAASAAAMANLPQPTAPGKSMVSLGVGSHRSQQAIAIGVSRISDNGKIVIKASATQNTNGNATVGAGVGFQW